MKFIKLVFFILLCIVKPSFAQVDENNQEIDVFANVCEKISADESKSSARLRASDKAAFKGVEEISDLKRYKEKLDTHKFNLKVYKLIDNYLEDMNINVISQDEEYVCVEVSAYIVPSSIYEVFSDVDYQKEEALNIEQENIEEDVNITVPPKPEIKINEQIAYSNDDSAVQDNNKEDTADEILYGKEEIKDFSGKKTSVFIDQTTFYNNTSTNGFFAHIEQEILKNGAVDIQATFDNPNYILKTKVLKAKVDNINSETARLHIVVGIELTDTLSSEVTTEHQNRFILFNTSEDAQSKAAELIKKLLSDGIAKILKNTKFNENISSSNNIITPPSK